MPDMTAPTTPAALAAAEELAAAKLSLAEATMQKMVEVEQERAQEIAALRAECAALRSAAEGARDGIGKMIEAISQAEYEASNDGNAVDAVNKLADWLRSGLLASHRDEIEATLTPGHGERALVCVREMVEAGQIIRDALDQHLVGEPGPHLVRFRAALDAARRMFPEGPGAKEEGR